MGGRHPRGVARARRLAPFQRPGPLEPRLQSADRPAWAAGATKPLTPSRLTPDEQYSHISLWCLWGSPMIIGTPIERLDPFTSQLLSNDEVLEVKQDPLGSRPGSIAVEGGELLVKELEDGSKAVGLFNPAEKGANVRCAGRTWASRAAQGARPVAAARPGRDRQPVRGQDSPARGRGNQGLAVMPPRQSMRSGSAVRRLVFPEFPVRLIAVCGNQNVCPLVTAPGRATPMRNLQLYRALIAGLFLLLAAVATGALP